MPHATPLIATIVGSLALAFVFGALAHRLRISPLVGYLLAGVIVGPFTPGYVADQGLALELAEIGVILLMFGVGLHFSLKDLLAVKAIAIPGAVIQIALATLLGWGLAWALGWPMAGGLVFGLALSVASTVVLLRALQERHALETERGRIAIGWLIVEDLVMVLVLVLLPPIAAALSEGQGLAEGQSARSDFLMPLLITLGKVTAFIVFMLVVGRRVIPWILHYIAHTGSRELFRLGVLAIALGVAFGAATLFGVSFALGAFFAGMVLAESELSHRAAEESLPLRDAFAVLFFVSVGMLFDPTILLKSPLLVAATFAIIVFGKSIAAFFIVKLFRHPTGTALIISASLAQIGEFSFILAALGVDLKLLPDEGRDLILAGAILSILANPLLFTAIDRLKRKSKPDEEKAPEADRLIKTALTGHNVVVGGGRVGNALIDYLRHADLPFLVIEDRNNALKRLRADGIEVIAANAADPNAIVAANIAGAKRLFVAIDNAFEAGQAVEQARAANASLEIIARAFSSDEIDHLKLHGADRIVVGAEAIAQGMLGKAFGSSAADFNPSTSSQTAK